MNANLTALDAEGAFTAESLPDYPLFHGLSERHRQILAECSMQASFSAGERVVETGEPTNLVYLVTSGSIGLETPGARAPMSVKTLGPGDILGWSWLFPPDCWQFDAIAEEPTEVICFRGSRLYEECNRDHGLGFELFKRMAQRHCIRKETPMTDERISTASFPPNANFRRNSLPSLVRGNPKVFGLKTNRAKFPQLVRDQSTSCWPQVLLDTAMVAIRCVGGASKSLITGEPYALLSPSARPSISSSEHEN